MEEQYDVIILGTGLKNCILSGLLSAHSKKKVLHMDRNDFYGATSASINLKQAKMQLDGMTDADAKNWVAENKEALGRDKDYNIDLCPKFLMASGDLVKILLKTEVTKYLDFKCVSGSYVFRAKDSLMHEVPMAPKAAWNSNLLSMIQKKRLGDFVQWVMQVDVADKKTWPYKGLMSKTEIPLDKWTPAQLFKYFKLEDFSIVFVLHAVALYRNDQPLQQVKQTIPLVERCKLYVESLMMYTQSPYLYPMWGLGGLPEGFSRLAAVHGGVYMLRKPIDEILYDDDGKVTGVMSGGEKAYCKQLIADPSYFEDTEKVKQTGFIARWIGVLSAMPPIRNSVEKETWDSGQVIFPPSETKHTSDIYCSLVSKGMECAAPGKIVAVCSTNVATEDLAAAKTLLEPIVRLLGQPGAEWWTVRKTFSAANHQVEDNIWITKTPDATTHFQAAAKEVKNIFHSMTGNALDLTKKTAKENLSNE